MRKPIALARLSSNSPVLLRSLLALAALVPLACGGEPMKGRNNNPPPPEEDAEAPPPIMRKDAGAPDKAPTPPMPDASPPDAMMTGSPDGSSDGSAPTGPFNLMTNPTGTLPPNLADLGVFTAFPDVTRLHARAYAFAPKHELWSNGLAKSRFVILPANGKVDITNREAWEFPVGTLFFKTFFSVDAAGKQTPIETRLIRKISDKVVRDPDMAGMPIDPGMTALAQWDFNVWEWNAAGTAASLLELRQRVPRMVPVGTAMVTHNIPKRGDCWNCHVANKSIVIGFDELRLNWKSPATAATTLLQDVAAKGMLSAAPPAAPMVVTGRNPTETAALEYLQGNCAHCHNGEQVAREPGARYPALDLRFNNAVKATVGIMTMTVGSKSGIRIVPRDPAKSILLEAVEAIGNPNADPEVKPMPTVGVDRLDPKAAMLLRAWIAIVTPIP